MIVNVPVLSTASAAARIPVFVSRWVWPQRLPGADVVGSGHRAGSIRSKHQACWILRAVPDERSSSSGLCAQRADRRRGRSAHIEQAIASMGMILTRPDLNGPARMQRIRPRLHPGSHAEVRSDSSTGWRWGNMREFSRSLCPCSPFRPALKGHHEIHRAQGVDIVPQRRMEHTPAAVTEVINIGSSLPVPLLAGSEYAVARTDILFPGPRSLA